MDDQRTDRSGGRGMNRPGVLVALGFAIALVAWAFAPGAGEIGGAWRLVVMAMWCLGGAIAGAGVFMPFRLTRWGIGLGIILQLMLLKLASG